MYASVVNIGGVRADSAEQKQPRPQKFLFISSQLFGFHSREQCHTWVETDKKFFVSSRTKGFKCKEQSFVRGVTRSSNILFSSLWFALISFESVGLMKVGMTKVIWHERQNKLSAQSKLHSTLLSKIKEQFMEFLLQLISGNGTWTFLFLLEKKICFPY